MSYWHIGWPSDIYTYRLRPFRWKGPVMFKSLMKRKYTFTCDRSGQCETIGDFFVCVRWAVFLIWISDRSFCRRSIGTRIDATLWRVRMISIKRVYPSRRGAGSSAMRVDGTSEYEISRRYDMSEETATRDDRRGWRRVNRRAMSWERIRQEYLLSGCEYPSWQSRRPPEVTVRRFRGVVVGVFFGPRYATCSRRCPAQ